MENFCTGTLNHESDMDDTKTRRRLNGVAWALLLILVGAVLAQNNMGEMSLERTIAIMELGSGLILLGVNIAGFLLKIEVSLFWSAVGIILIADVAGATLRYDVPVFPLALIAAGLWVIVKAMKAP